MSDNLTPTLTLIAGAAKPTLTLIVGVSKPTLALTLTPKQFFWCHERPTPTPTPKFWVSENPTIPLTLQSYLVVSKFDTDTGNFGVRAKSTISQQWESNLGQEILI